MFGRNASLDVKGSFHVSTADFLRFTDEEKFFATTGQDSVLTVAAPAGFGFLVSNPAPITIRGSTLQVPEGKSFSLVGGDIMLVGGSLQAPSGRMQLVSVASPGDVRFSPLELAPDLRVDGFVRLGRIDLSRGTILNTSGNGGGSVLLRGERLLVDQSSILANGKGPGPGGNLSITAMEDISIIGNSSLEAGVSGNGSAGHVAIFAPLLSLDDGDILTQTSFDSSGRGGDIEVSVGRLTLTGGATISTSAFGAGPGGNLALTATDEVTISGRNISGSSSRLSSSGGPFSTGRAGRVTISAPRLSLDDGFILTEASGAGDAGDVELRAGWLTLTGGAAISSTTFGSGLGGTLMITTTDTITISGQNSGLFSDTKGSGQGGHINLRARELRLTERAMISATSSGAADAGRLTITATERVRSDQSSVTTAATRADGGDIELKAGSWVQLIDSEITASVGGGPRTVGGNVTLDSPFVILDGSKIIANAIAGKGGRISIAADVFLADLVSVVSASSEQGIQGTVDIRAPVTQLSGTLAPLPQAFVSAAALLPARCAARAPGGVYSSLVLGARDGLPLDPSVVLPSPLTLDERLVDPAGTGEPHQHESIAKFALLGVDNKFFTRLRGKRPSTGALAALDWGCAK
jgi:large exoprotein involved in heme utilization and adhesion